MKRVSPIRRRLQATLPLDDDGRRVYSKIKVKILVQASNYLSIVMSPKAQLSFVRSLG